MIISYTAAAKAFSDKYKTTWLSEVKIYPRKATSIKKKELMRAANASFNKN